MKPIAKPPMMILPPLTASSAAARATASPACAASRDSGDAAAFNTSAQAVPSGYFK